MAVSKEKQKEPVTPKTCVCGGKGITVKHKGRYMVSCSNVFLCGIRGGWFGSEETAVKSYNTEVDAARCRKRQEAGQ